MEDLGIAGAQDQGLPVLGFGPLPVQEVLEQGVGQGQMGFGEAGIELEGLPGRRQGRGRVVLRPRLPATPRRQGELPREAGA